MGVWLLFRVDGVSDEHASGITNHEKQECGLAHFEITDRKPTGKKKFVTNT